MEMRRAAALSVSERPGEVAAKGVGAAAAAQLAEIGDAEPGLQTDGTSRPASMTAESLASGTPVTVKSAFVIWANKDQTA
jgi:hypothetical protein